MVQHRRVLVLYTTAVCNLNCRYCYIDKNPALKKIDDILDESFKGDYYYNFAKEIFPDPKQLDEVQFWGGEPSLRLDRAIHTVEKLIPEYPRLTKFMMSTNLTSPTWEDQFFGFLNILSKYNRHFTFDLQLSLDGPTEINDYSRGLGVTEKFTNTFKRLMEIANEKIPNNVSLNWHFKPTLDSNSIKDLQTKEDIIAYYRFFESYYSLADNYKSDKFNYGMSIPNTACPSPHTKEDGLLFANFCRLCREIEKENEVMKYFTHYKYITPFHPRNDYHMHKSYKCPGGVCGTGRFVIGLLPYDMISVCHNGFVDIISDYKMESTKNINDKLSNTSLDFKFFTNDKAKSRMCFNKEQLLTYEKQIEYFYHPDTTTRIANIASMITLLARVHQVDEKYMDNKLALQAAYFIQESTSYCIRDNINSTGSNSLYPVGLLKLLLNGAKEYITNEF